MSEDVSVTPSLPCIRFHIYNGDEMCKVKYSLTSTWLIITGIKPRSWMNKSVTLIQNAGGGDWNVLCKIPNHSPTRFGCWQKNCCVVGLPPGSQGSFTHLPVEQFDVETYDVANGLPLRRHVVNEKLTDWSHYGLHVETGTKQYRLLKYAN